MMRNDDAFKVEILRRKEIYLKKRRARITVFSSGVAALALCAAILISLPGHLRSMNGMNGMEENYEIPDVIVRIRVDDTVYEDGEAVGVRMDALSKYVPLPNGTDTEDQYQGAPSCPSDILSSDLSAESTGASPDDSVQSPVLKVSGVEIVVEVGNVTQEYFLSEKCISWSGGIVRLTEAEYGELWALFGTEDSE